MKWMRTVTFMWEADTFEEAEELWEENGPETRDPIESVAFSNIEAEDPEEVEAR